MLRSARHGDARDEDWAAGADEARAPQAARKLSTVAAGDDEKVRLSNSRHLAETASWNAKRRPHQPALVDNRLPLSEFAGKIKWLRR